MEEMDNIDGFIEAIEAFADGEPVDPVALERALAAPEGRAHLIDLLVLRGFVASASAGAGSAISLSHRPSRPSPFRWIPVAAAVAIAAGLGGYALGGRWAARTPADQTAVAVAPTADAGPPAPTRVIRFEQGVDWTEHGGGN